ncbi:MAG: AIR synthase related protein, partial [Chloroflexota bacterium]|nr:AIR synthase related protein [Chloroflexota bacterium]
MGNPLALGKLPAEDLADLLDRYAHVDERVVVGPGIGVDATAIEFGDQLLVAKTDPITFATDEIGWYAVNVNANDVACLGATPRWFLATLLLPAGLTDRSLAERIFAQLSAACRHLGVSLCGGHTEITHGLERPIVVGQMLGEVTRDDLVLPGGAQAGDVVLLTKGIAVEAT